MLNEALVDELLEQRELLRNALKDILKATLDMPNPPWAIQNAANQALEETFEIKYWKK